MKFLTLTFLISLPCFLIAQEKVVGQYRDYFGNSLVLNVDKTFRYKWQFDMAASWTKGVWSLKGDTIYFRMIPIYDTLSPTNTSDSSSDIISLSMDDISERITPIQNTVAVTSSGGQNRRPFPEKLLFKGGRLYKILNGKVVVKKQRGFGTSKKWPPWYFKSDD
jgi:hypothetical protein